MNRARIANHLAAATTLWGITTAFLADWSASSSTPSLRNDGDVSDGSPFARWHDLSDRVEEHFKGRPSGRLHSVDKKFLTSWIEKEWDRLGFDTLHSIAWGIDSVAHASFGPDWRASVRDAGDQHVLAGGDFYPVPEPDPRTYSATKAKVTSHPWMLSDPREGELPHVRRHSEDLQLRIVIDFGFERQLFALMDDLRPVATGHPNHHLSELELVDVGARGTFPVRPRNPGRQTHRILSLVRAAFEDDVGILVLPELCTSREIVGAVQKTLNGEPGQRLIVAGSFHHIQGPDAANTTVGLLSKTRRALVHHKLHPFTDHSTSPPRTEGIAQQKPPTLRVYEGGDFRFALLICKDLLDTNVTRALSRLGVNVVLVPAMSPKTGTFVTRIEALVADTQALSIVANGPIFWHSSQMVSPFSMFGQPFEGRKAICGDPAACNGSPHLVTFDVGARRTTGHGL